MEKYRPLRPAREPVAADEIRVTAIGKLAGYMTYASTLITEQKMRQLTIKASGSAIRHAITLAEELKRRYKGLHQLNKCGITTVTQVYVPVEEGLDQVSDERPVAFLEIKLSFDQLDEKDPGYQMPLPEDLVTGKAPSGRGRGGYRGSFRGSYRGRGGRRVSDDTSVPLWSEGEIEEEGVCEEGVDTPERRQSYRGRGRGRGIRGGFRGSRGAARGSFRGGQRGGMRGGRERAE